jgi:hypothetical protein
VKHGARPRLLQRPGGQPSAADSIEKLERFPSNPVEIAEDPSAREFKAIL